jgi:hypothetical protein
MNQSLLDVVEMDLGDLTVYINVWNNSLSRKWLTALNHLIEKEYHLEKNYCFVGFADSPRNGQFLCEQINTSIAEINAANLDYKITDVFTVDSVMDAEMNLQRDRFNRLHKYFEDLQGTSGHMSWYYTQATPQVKWHIRQLNLLCHEFESWALSWRKKHTAPEWMRPSQLMCWLNAPRFVLDEEDYELFGIETLNRQLGGVYVGVNKAVGKHHWEVFQDEGRDSRIGELTTGTLKAQTEAAGDFDIEWARDPGSYEWQIRQLCEFREWLAINRFDPNDKTLTIGHPQVGQIDLQRSFGTEDYQAIWAQLTSRLDVTAIRTSTASVTYPYQWSDPDYTDQQIALL